MSAIHFHQTTTSTPEQFVARPPARGGHHCPLVYLGSAWRQSRPSARKTNR